MTYYMLQARATKDEIKNKICYKCSKWASIKHEANTINQVKEIKQSTLLWDSFMEEVKKDYYQTENNCV